MSTSTPPRRGRPPKKAKLDHPISRESSPDPLAIIPGSEPESSSAPLKRAKRQRSEEEEELDQIIVAVPSPNKAPRSAATSARKPRTPRKQASAAPESTAEADEAEPKSRTPKKGTASGTISTPRKRSSATPTRATPTKATPSRANPAKAKGKAPPKSPTSEKSESEVASDGQDLVSAVQFRRNEAVKAGRDARNFNWSGDVNAPRTTRKSAAVDDHEVDRYESAPMDEDEAMDGPADATAADKLADDVSTLFEGPSADQPAAPPRKAQSLGAGPTEMLEQVLKRLSGVIPVHPAPFDDEDRGMLDGFDPSWYLEAGIKGAKPVKGSDSAVNGGDDTAKSLGRASTTGNEALRQLVTLLRGTVERGEGNSCLMMGSKGCGKTRTINRAISLLSRTARQWTSASQGRPDIRPIVVRLSGLAQINDMLAIREMGRQIAEGEGQAFDPEDDDLDLDIAPTTLPSQLLAQLSASSPRAIIIVLDNFELFTEHARQALLYCLFDVVQSIRTGPMQTTGRGVAVIGATSRIDTPLLLEKRVKSRFSQRVYRVVSPLAGADPDTRVRLLRSALLPWYGPPAEDDQVGAQYTDDSLEWMSQWETQVNEAIEDADLERALERACELTTDVRLLYRPFIRPVQDALTTGTLDVRSIVMQTREQTQASGWGARFEKLKGLSHPALVILIIAKHLAFAGKEELNLAMAEHEYQRFARNELAGSGRTRWSPHILRLGWEQLLHSGLLTLATRFKPSTNPSMQRFIMCRSLLTRHEILAFFRGQGSKLLGTELTNWGRTAGGHA